MRRVRRVRVPELEENIEDFFPLLLRPFFSLHFLGLFFVRLEPSIFSPNRLDAKVEEKIRRKIQEMRFLSIF